MIFQAVLSNRDRPEIGVATIPFPIPEEEYAHCLELLAPMGIDDPVEQQCNVVEIQSGYRTLSQMEGTLVNLDELDYLAKRLDSFCDGEDEQFEGMVHLLGLRNVQDLISLTFCCQQATVISDFSNLKDIGQMHYLNTHGGGAPVEVIKNLDAEKIARDLIASDQGKITPYGVVYDNGMELEHCYVVGAFPPYLYTQKVLDVEIASPHDPAEITLLQLPMPEEQLERMLIRGGMEPKDVFDMAAIPARCPSAVVEALSDFALSHGSIGTLREINQMCRALEKLTGAEQTKLAAAVQFAQPEYPFQIRHLAENLDQFEFVPGVKNDREYGEYMIRQSEQFEYDPNLEPYYDYEKYGADHTAWHGGSFSEYGYVAYLGSLSLDELMMEDPAEAEQAEGMQMGGMA